MSKVTISDHYLINGVRKFPTLKEPPEIIEIRDYKKFNEQNFFADKATISDLNLDQYDNPNKSWLVGSKTSS